MKDYDSQVAEIMPEKLAALRAIPESPNDSAPSGPSRPPAPGAESWEDAGARMQEVARGRGDVDDAEPKPAQLPIWAEPQRVTPTTTLRTALFSCARRRGFTKDTLIASWTGTEIRFTGETLNQFDESVWMQLIHMYRQQGEPQDLKVRLNAKPFIRELGKKGKKSGKHVTLLRSAMGRLQLGAVIIKSGGLEYHGSILNDFTLDEDRGHFVATLNPKYLELLGAGHTRVDWETRKALPTGLATWMHRYVFSHQATGRHPHRIGLGKLRPLTGMNSSPKEFKRHLKRTMELLEKHSVVAAWRITPNNALEFSRAARPRLTR